ncbi:MAG TPA: M20/M25/M40 family metallo-hydrolase, partial [Bacillota bacterium]|nr:M20/M25/M40 family metallo-hydrolase [Bacillota bacterium]
MIYLYIFLGLLGILVILLLVALYHSHQIKDKEEVVTPEITDLKKADVLAKEFSQMIKVETLSYEKELGNTEKFDELHQVMKKLFPKTFEKLTVIEFDGGSLLLEWKGKSSEKPMVLMAHQDVVPAEKEDWQFEPFSGKVTEDEVYGRGTLDTKSTLYSFFKATEELINEGFVPEHDLYLSTSTDEEISGIGAELAVDYMKKNHIKPYIILDEGGAIVSGALP